MIDGLMLGTLIFLSTIISWYHLPTWIKTLTINHFIVSELVFTLMTYITITNISRSLVAVVAAAWAGLLMNFATMIYQGVNKYAR